jgi:AraC-like DNA-binding protein
MGDLKTYLSVLIVFLLLMFSFFILFKGIKNVTTKILLVYFICQMSGWLINIMDLHGSGSFLPNFLYALLYPVYYLWIPLFYLFISSLISGDFRLKSGHLVHFLPFLVSLLLVLTRTVMLLHSNGTIGDDFYTNYPFRKYTSNFFYLQFLVYGIIIINDYWHYVRLAPQDGRFRSERFLHFLSGSVSGFFIVYGLDMFVIFGKNYSLGIPEWLVYLDYLLYLLFFSTLFLVCILYPEILDYGEQKRKYYYSNLSESKASEISNTLDRMMTEMALFRNPDFSLKDFSKVSGVKERHISQILNEIKSRNFADYVNNYRVNAAKELLCRTDFSKRTMMDVWMEAGFNSKTTFNNVFKKFTGLTPSQYRKVTL